MKLPNHAVKYTLAVLLLASLTTTQILSTSYAKYTTSSGPVSDSARVAKYDVTVTEVDKDGITIDRESNIWLEFRSARAVGQRISGLYCKDDLVFHSGESGKVDDCLIFVFKVERLDT